MTPPQRLALHDRVSATRVLQDAAANALPRWAMAWIAAQAALLLWAMWAWSAASRDALQAGLGPAGGRAEPSRRAQTSSCLGSAASAGAQTSRHMKYITPNITMYSTSSMPR
ncbi:MAG: hypothetical protein ACREO8_09025 [Luteimonas sp.]